MDILIADDEPLARARLRSLIRDLGAGYRVVGEAGNGEEVVRRCLEGAVDLVLLDIRMPLLDGLDAAGQLAGLETPPAVVFVTAFDVYAVQAFERQAVDYLVKPVRLERLRNALERARVLTRPQLEVLRATTEGGAAGASAGRICASFRGRMECVPVEEVIYLRAEQKYVVVRHPGGQLLVEESLKALEQVYGGLFLRLHRNALVARQRLTGIQKASDGRCLALLRGCDETLEISRRHLGAVREWLKGGGSSVA